MSQAGIETGWLTADSWLEPYWPEHPHAMGDDDDSGLLAVLLTAAREQCVAYAPKLPVDAPVPESWRLAQAMQARALHRATITGDGDQIGPDGFTVRVYPMDRSVKALLRPRRRPVIL
jgi:hypothetical protein